MENYAEFWKENSLRPKQMSQTLLVVMFTIELSSDWLVAMPTVNLVLVSQP